MKHTKEFIVYRAEKIWEGTEDIYSKYLDGTTDYKFYGLTSTTLDPRVGYGFNKLIDVPLNEKLIFEITIPVGSKIIIPGIDQITDPEFEVTLNHGSIIDIIVSINFHDTTS